MNDPAGRSVSEGTVEAPRPRPFGLEPRRLSSGAWKGVAIAAGVVAFLGLTVLAVLATQSHRLLDFALGELEEQVEARLPEDLGHAERERLATAFDGARNAIRERRVGIAGLERLQRELLGNDDGSLSPEQVRRLTEALEALDRSAAEADP
ncbi:MAG: hypothetical protein R2991_05300 [Thermoanaerobaculia bacterium]